MYRAYDIAAGYISRKNFKKDFKSVEEAFEAIKAANLCNEQYAIGDVEKDVIVAIVNKKDYKLQMVA